MKSETLALGDELQVTFRWTGDRYAHVVAARRGGTMPLLSSCEGTSDDWWPASPPLQQLNFAELEPGRRAALLVGMAGRSHWSLSVVADETRGEVTFDAACRATQPPAMLGSRYRPAGALRRADGGPVRLELPSIACALSIDTIEGEPAARLVCVEQDLRIDLPPFPHVLPATFRWKYRVALVR